MGIETSQSHRSLTSRRNPAPSAPTTIAVGKALERGGLSRDQANIVSMGFPEMLTGMANGSVDVAYVAEPFVTNALDRDLAVRWKPISDLLPDHMATAWMYSQRLVQERPEAARRLTVALMRAARDYMDAVDTGRGRPEVVATLLGPVDVVCDPAAITGDPTAGALAWVEAWLVGRPA